MANKKKLDNDKQLRQLAEIARKEVGKRAASPASKIIDGDVKILVPMQIAMMRTNISKIQQDILLTIIAHIKERLVEIVSGKVKKGEELSLFSQEEIINDGRQVQLEMFFKEFDVSAQNYPKLASALAMLAFIPIELPYQGASGKEYYKYTNLCTVYIPKDKKYNKVCYITMDSDIAKHLMNFDLGHFFVGLKTSRKLSKYAERIYWILKGNINNDGVTLSTKELRKEFGLEHKYEDFYSLEKKVLKNSQEEIKDLYSRHECECYFKYEKIYNGGRKKRGEPDAIRFEILYDKSNLLEYKLQKANEEIMSEIRSTMSEDLDMPESLINHYMKLVNDDNKEDVLTKLISIKIGIDTNKENGSPVSSKIAYTASSLNKFFNSFKNKGKEEDKPKNISHLSSKEASKKWIECLQHICQGYSDDIINRLFSYLRFHSYENGTLVISAPDSTVIKELQEKYSKPMQKNVSRYFGEDVQLSYINRDSK